MTTGVPQSNRHKNDLYSLFSNLDNIKCIEDITEKLTLTNKSLLSWKIEYSQSTMNELNVQLIAENGLVLSIPLTQISKVEVSSNEIIIQGKSYDIF